MCPRQSAPHPAATSAPGSCDGRRRTSQEVTERIHKHNLRRPPPLDLAAHSLAHHQVELPNDKKLDVWTHHADSGTAFDLGTTNVVAEMCQFQWMVPGLSGPSPLAKDLEVALKAASKPAKKPAKKGSK